MGQEPQSPFRSEVIVSGRSRSRRAAGPILLAAALASFAAGCAPGGYYRSTQDQLDSLLTKQTELIKRVERLDRKLEETRGGVSAGRATTESRIAEMGQRLDVVVGKLEESQARMLQLILKVDTASARAAQSSARRDTSGILDPEAAYQAAYSDYAAGHYALARDAFREYLKHYPDTEIADNAQYWIGESLYATGDFAGAIAEFKLVAERYPKGDKVPAALLKIGIANQRLKNNDEAKKYFRQVVQKYPKSQEAILAKERLSRMS